jgi:hypothetical protein
MEPHLLKYVAPTYMVHFFSLIFSVQRESNLIHNIGFESAPIHIVFLKKLGFFFFFAQKVCI